MDVNTVQQNIDHLQIEDLVSHYLPVEQDNIEIKMDFVLLVPNTLFYLQMVRDVSM